MIIDSETTVTACVVDQGEPSLFEKSAPGACAVTLGASAVPSVDPASSIPAHLLADEAPPLPEMAELCLVRHFTRLAHRAFSIDTNFYPLGSCTMKYNPRLNERVAAMPAFANLHPYQPIDQVQGMLELLYTLREFLQEISGLAEVSLHPAAGAHGEMSSLMMITAYHRDRGEKRPNVLVPDTAHGTNPASCAMCARHTHTVSSCKDGKVDLDDLRGKVDEQTAALMITNPNTVGVFDDQIGDIAEILHKHGALLYLDGANMNAMLGITRPGDFGVDVMHFNTHKTFSTPHGGGGPGAGPIAVIEKLAPFLPVPQVVRKSDGTFDLAEDRPKSIGKVRAFIGQIGVLVRCYTYIRSLGAEGLRTVSEKAVLSANYLAARLEPHYEFPVPGPYAHEFVMVPKAGDAGVTETDFAKRLIDFGFHPPTMSWPIPNCLMIEPTETESLRTLNRFADTMIKIAVEARETPDVLKNAPHNAKVSRLDEVTAARKPNVRWTLEKEKREKRKEKK
ncbi:MAG: aminomethyl-transferring glycine dehydrogenase subunit GcvPB [Planctomycetota bacterium]|nr:aminomethyl-transferring glycine dehydrogenase subunit GcvPB [Planctomycetota bacterium]